ncbi:MAG: hypothetical protein ACRYGP_17570 [Janthinobacterium lividum]
MVDEPKPAPAIMYGGDVGRAPVIFFDAAPNFGGFNGIVAFTLSAALQVPGNDGKSKVESHVVAHLRTNVEGIKALRAAIDAALFAMEPTKGKAN